MLIRLAVVVVKMHIADPRAELFRPVRHRNATVAVSMTDIETDTQARIINAVDNLAEQFGVVLVRIFEVDPDLIRQLGQQVLPELPDG